MLVSMRMVHPPTTISARASVRSAMDLTMEESIQTLPVVDRQGRLLGITTKDDLSQFIVKNTGTPEIVDDTTVEEMMERDVLTVTENTPIEEAVRIIVDYQVSALPVVRGNFVVGIIDDISILRMMMEMTSSRSDGVRLTCSVENDSEFLRNLYSKVSELNGNVRSLSSYEPDQKGYHLITLKIAGVEKYNLKQLVSPLVQEIIDIR